ncbi:hypothetical protein ACLBWX_21655 [Methylobacterium sp. M6A4_1b]
MAEGEPPVNGPELSAGQSCLRSVASAAVPIGHVEDLAMGTARLMGTAALGLSLAASPAIPGTPVAGSGLSAYQGAWVLEGRDCGTVYAPAGKGSAGKGSAGKSASFKKPIDIFAPAFIIAGKRLRTPLATCSIKALRPSGDRNLLVLDCANAVAAQEVRVHLSPQPNGALKRYYHAEDPTGIDYRRC